MGSSLERAQAELGSPDEWRCLGSFGTGEELPVTIYLRRRPQDTRVPLGLILFVEETDVSLLIDAGWSRSKRFSSRGPDNKWRTFGKW